MCPAPGGCCPAAGAAGGSRPWLCVAREPWPRWHIGRFPGVSSDRVQPLWVACAWTRRPHVSVRRAQQVLQPSVCPRASFKVQPLPFTFSCLSPSLYITIIHSPLQHHPVSAAALHPHQPFPTLCIIMEAYCCQIVPLGFSLGTVWCSLLL